MEIRFSKMIPYGQHLIDDDDIQAVVSTLKSSHLTQGAKVPELESIISDKLNAKYAICTNNATTALHLACVALNLGNDDYLWTSPISFVASANCGIYCGASIDFVDIDPTTANISVKALEQKLIIAEKLGKLPKILVAVHFAGLSAEMEKIRSLSIKYNFKIIEDASHALGGKYNNEYIGCSHYSDVTVFSLHPVKIITSGEGGIALTRDLFLAERMLNLRSHGITKDNKKFKRKSHGDWYYEQQEVGFNYRMSDINASLAISQLSKLDRYVKIRNELADEYKSNFKNLPVRFQKINDDCLSAYHLFYITLDDSLNISARNTLYTYLQSAGIGTQVHYIPIPMQPYYKKLGHNVNDFPNAISHYHKSLSLPLFPSLQSSQHEYIIETFIKFFAQKTVY